MTEHNQVKPAHGELEQFTVFDTQNDHYQLAMVGGDGDLRLFSCLVHVDIKDDKVWIQHDGTEVRIANELVELGIPKQSIVLGSHDPNAYRLTEFAVDRDFTITRTIPPKRPPFPA